MFIIQSDVASSCCKKKRRSKKPLFIIRIIDFYLNTLQKQDLRRVSLGSHNLKSIDLVPGSSPALMGIFRHIVFGMSLQSLSSTHVSLLIDISNVRN